MIGEEYIQKIATCVMLCSGLSLKFDLSVCGRPSGLECLQCMSAWGAFAGHQEVSL